MNPSTLNLVQGRLYSGHDAENGFLLSPVRVFGRFAFDYEPGIVGFRRTLFEHRRLGVSSKPGKAMLWSECHRMTCGPHLPLNRA